MRASPNLLGNADDAVLRRNYETAETDAVTPRAAAAVPETKRTEQAALLRPKIAATPLQRPH